MKVQLVGSWGVLARMFVAASLSVGIGVACGGDSESSCSGDEGCSATERCLDGRCVARADASVMDAGGPAEDAGGPSADGGVDAGIEECPDGCGDGQCIAGSCCARERACEEVCCGEGDVCSFGRCVTIGESCSGTEECAADAYCELSLGDEVACGTATAPSGRCLSRPPTCAEGEEPDPSDPTCVTACSFAAGSGALDVELRYSWGAYDGDASSPNASDVRNSPIVINLDDDDCDGRITARDIPEIVVIASPDDTDRPDGTNPVGDLVVLGIEAGELREKWRVVGAVHPWTYPAAGEIDGVAGNEVVACSVDRTTVAAYGLSEDGSELVERWVSDPLPRPCSMPSLADLDQDGDVEIVLRGAVLDGTDGSVELTYETAPDGLVIAADVDDDPAHRLEIVSPSRVYRPDGDRLVAIGDSGLRGNHVLVAQLDGVGNPEIVSLRVSDRTMVVWRYAAEADTGAEVVRVVSDINGPLDATRCSETSAGRTGGGGPPTAGDVNADGVPDIAVAGGVGYAVFDGSRLVDPAVTDEAMLFLWADDTVDCSSAQTGSSVFDFNGDARAEVLYADEHTFRIYEGATGSVLFETCNTNGTILEQPIVADVDNDGRADIVVVANAVYRSCLDDSAQRISGVRIFSGGSDDWVRTRRVWNQHAYHITNVEEDGAIPVREAPNWADSELNNFRLNRQPGNEFAAPDLVVALEPRCTGGLGLNARVTNLGEALVPPGARVVVYRGTAPGDGSLPGDDQRLGEGVTSLTLYPAQSETFGVDLDDATGRAILLEETEGAFAVVTPPAGVTECRPDNGVSSLERGCTLR